MGLSYTHIPRVLTQYHITHLLLRHISSSYLRVLSQLVLYSVLVHGLFTNILHGRNLRRLVENYCLQRLFAFLSCVSTPGSDVTAEHGPALLFTWKEAGPTELGKRKNIARLTSRQLGVCLHFPRLCLGDEYQRTWPSWWVSLHRYGCPGFSTLEYGAVKDLWLLRVWQVGENRLRWIWTSIQSPARTVENMAGYQVPSLPSCGWQVSSSCWAICLCWC